MNGEISVGEMTVYIKTNLPNENNEYVEDNITTIFFSINNTERWTSETALEKMEGDFVDSVKSGSGEFEIEEELWMKYPASELERVYAPNGEVGMTFEYDEDKQLYYADYVDVFSVYDWGSFKILWKRWAEAMR